MLSDVPSSNDQIPLAIPQIDGNEWSYIKDCLDTGWVSSVGSYVDRFEELLAKYVGSAQAIATSSGTAALHIALLVAGIKPDDEVLVSDLSFIAPANAIRYVNAWPVFMDAEPIHWQMDPNKLSHFLDNNCHWSNGCLINNGTGRQVTAIVPVHILGHPCDMEPIMETAEKYNLVVIEDASESLGASYKNQFTGNIGHIGCFSFNGNKLITTGGGGMIVTDNSNWAERAKYLTTQAKDDSVEYFHKEIGYNYRLTNIQAALGVAQMERIDDFIQKKRDIAQIYHSSMQDKSGLTLMRIQADTDPSYWLYTILLDEKITLDERKQIIKMMNSDGIGVRPLWHTLHNLPPYTNCESYHIQHSVSLYKRAISLPSSVGLTQDEQNRTIATLIRMCSEFEI